MKAMKTTENYEEAPVIRSKSPSGKSRAKAGSAEKPSKPARSVKPEKDKPSPARGSDKAKQTSGEKKAPSKKAKAAAKPEIDKSGSSSRTPQVMKLVEPQGSMVNPVIIAGKSRIPQQLRGRAPLSRIMRREAAEIFGEELYTDPNELLTVDLTELVIKENAGELLRRFNACCCDKCIDELSRRTADKIPSRFVRITRAALEENAPELAEQKEPLKKSALSAMIRELIVNKRRHFHNS